nr:hypothetical protein [Tanacetum cinerariifolium]
SAGNDDVQSAKYIEEMDHHTNAIMWSIESRPIVTFCLLRRSQAHEILGNIIDAIVDCNLAIALNGDYTKAMHEKKNVEELEFFRQHLSTLERLMNEGIPMDLYKILELKGSESDIEFKKAYDKVAHSLDEAGKFLAISESGGNGHIWKEIKKTIHMDADEPFLRKLERHMLYYPSPTSFKFCKDVFLHAQIMSKD